MIKVDPHADANILERLRAAGILLESPCNGKGLCGKCKVRILNGEVSPLTERERACLSGEEIEADVRLACLTVPKGPVEIDPLGLLGEAPGKVLGGGKLPDIPFAPMVTAAAVRMAEPDFENGWSLCDSIGNGAKLERDLPLSFLQKLPDMEGKKNLWMIRQGLEYLDLREDLQAFGLAVDIGTTTVAVSLVDLCTGTIKAEDGFVNPQKAFGLDVLSRIHYDMEHPGGVLELRRVIVERLQQSAAKLAAITSVSLDAVYEVVVGGNATMLHALLGVSLKSLGRAPYNSVFTGVVNIPARELGFELNREARIYCIPAVSTYIGGDIVAGVLTARIDRAKDTVLFIDIGTNGEIVLSRKGKMYACSCAAGPALEGMNISCGMRAEPGAVEHVSIDGDRVLLGVIGNAAPKGLCGSGILEAVSQAVEKGLIGKTGRIAADSPLTVVDENGKRCILLDKKFGIRLTQNDIRQVQLCKGAILSGVLTLMERLQLSEKDIDRVIVAGQFGKHLKPESLTGAQLLPKAMAKSISYIGNSSMTGAQMCLLSKYERQRAEQIAQNIQYVELSVSPGYEKLFTRSLQFGGV